jgi:hypothetical protein
MFTSSPARDIDANTVGSEEGTQYDATSVIQHRREPMQVS